MQEWVPLPPDIILNNDELMGNYQKGWQEKVSMEPLILHCHRYCLPSRMFSVCNHQNVCNKCQTRYYQVADREEEPNSGNRNSNRTRPAAAAAETPGGVPLPPLDLTEDNVNVKSLDSCLTDR